MNKLIDKYCKYSLNTYSKWIYSLQEGFKHITFKKKLKIFHKILYTNWGTKCL